MNPKEILRWSSMVLSAAIGVYLFVAVAIFYQKSLSLPFFVTAIAAAGILAAPFFIIFHSCVFRRYDRLAFVLVYVASTALFVIAAGFVFNRFFPVRF